jgi:hypothetical protein
MKTLKLKLACSEILSEQRTVKRIVVLCVDMEHAGFLTTVPIPVCSFISTLSQLRVGEHLIFN